MHDDAPASSAPYDLSHHPTMHAADVLAQAYGQTTEIFAYCLAVAAERTGVLLHAICVISNHYYAVVTAPQARLPEFLRYVHEYVAKCINASLGRWENFWATEPPSAVRLEEAEDVLDKP